MVIHVMVPPVHHTLRQHVLQTTVAVAGLSGAWQAMKYYVMVRNTLIVHTDDTVCFIYSKFFKLLLKAGERHR